MIKRETQQDLMKGRVAHSLPGRLRLTADGLCLLPDEAAEIANALAHIRGVRRARITPRIGSVLLEYDERLLDSTALTEQADMVLARYSMPALRARHAASSEEAPEAPMTTTRLPRRAISRMLFSTVPFSPTQS